jgi:hypothetical protein
LLERARKITKSGATTACEVCSSHSVTDADPLLRYSAMSIGKTVQKFRRKILLQTLGLIQNKKTSYAVNILKKDAILSTERLVKF